MNEELIGELHIVASGVQSKQRRELLEKAADAIEQLEKELDRAKEWASFWEKEANEALKKFQVAVASKPRWIPVTERLPEEFTDVLCYYEYFRYGDYNCMFRTIDRGYFGNGIWGGEAGQGHKNKVLAWMPLPEQPEVM